ncbi:hypothetical protein L2E82_45209 [Cichorium intybus]|uniref:Uncharacterized protein n=1 Tax=Cichorium intybus TaxID=13427 RepID=A0ACB8ZRG4_CICIN|nr:hypothetical protein L2E82_45209 [Cichorium intybus]
MVVDTINGKVDGVDKLTRKMDAVNKLSACTPDYDRKAELIAFDETKAGVKGLVDAGAFVVNGGDLLQLITNDNFVSSRHKVMANKTADPRISVASFFMRYLTDAPNVLAPIKELLSEDNPAKYRGTTEKEYSSYFHQKGLDETSALLHFKI